MNGLLYAGAEIDESDYVVGTPLHAAASQGGVDIARIPIESGADVDAESEQLRARAVHLAASFGDAPILELLLDGGAGISSTAAPTTHLGAGAVVRRVVRHFADAWQPGHILGAAPFIQRRRRKESATTRRLLSAIVPAAMIGVIVPVAASRTVSRL
ncbi:MAG: ankyrin repeat domain-containing protein [Hyphomicrobiales bacterium]|nr:ankyrin repeat domain-containing protein [Hyphomicrobiales bacterium]